MSTVADPSSIRRLRLRLHCDQALGHPLQQRTSRLFHSHLQSQLQALFARLAPRLGTRTLALDKLVLDLGEIASDDFDQQFANRLLAQLEQRLADLIGILPPSRQPLPDPVSSPPWKDPGHSAFTKRIVAQDETWPALVRTASAVAEAWPASLVQLAPVAAVLAYLHDGYWPLPAHWRGGPGAWLRRQIDAGADDWTPVLALCCSRPDALRRVRGTFDLVTQSALQHAARSGWAPVEPQAAERWQRWCSAVQGGRAVSDIELDLPTSTIHSRADSLSDVPPASARTSQLSDATPASARTSLSSDTISASARTSLPSDVLLIPAVPPATTSASDALTPIAVSNAGLVLLWPMLARLFNQLQLLHESDFIDDTARARAVCLLDWLLWDDAGLDGMPPEAVDLTLQPEWRTPLTKLLCGWPPMQPLPGWHRPDTRQRELLRTWLFSSLGLWPAMQRVGTAWARELFLRREGQVLCSPGRTELVVARDASDALLQDLPWPLHDIDLPWMPTPLLVDWIEPGQAWQDLLPGSYPT